MFDITETEDEDMDKIFKLGVGALVGIIFTVGVICVACIVVAVLCRKRRKYPGHVQRETPVPPPEQTPLAPASAAPQPPSSQPAVQPYMGMCATLTYNTEILIGSLSLVQN